MKKCLALIVTLMVAIASWADTATNVKYIDADGIIQTCPKATIVTSSLNHAEWTPGWYVVLGDYITLDQAVDCSGDVHLILADGAKLVIKPGSSVYSGLTGILVGDGNTLQIYGQEKGTGTLSVTGAQNCAAIGGKAKSIVINGGTLNVTGGQEAAGIGSSYNNSVESIVINGGTITAGSVSATYGGGAAIGSGAYTTCGSITINGGTITATGSDYAAAIGTGCGGTCGRITINGGVVYASGGVYGTSLTNIPAAIGKGKNGSCEGVFVFVHERIYAGIYSGADYIENDGSDLQGTLTQNYVKILDDPTYMTVNDVQRLADIVLGRRVASDTRYELDAVDGYSVADLARLIHYLRNGWPLDPNSIQIGGSNKDEDPDTGETPPTTAESKRRPGFSKVNDANNE